MGRQQIICDTDVMIDFWEPRNKRHDATVQLINDNIGLNNVVLTAITKIELLAGALSKADAHKISAKLSRFNIYLLTPEITLKAFALIETYSVSHRLALPDGIIAATALTTNTQLFTYNVKDYKFIKGLSLFQV